MPIEVNHLEAMYAAGTPFETQALQQVSLRIKDGEFVGIMGQTGCGKTTLIEMIAGLQQPSNGHVLLDGEDIHAKGYDRNLLRKKIGVVFQYPEQQLFETTVERDVAFALKHSELSQEQIRQRVEWALEQMGLCYGEIAHKSPLSLSGGEKRKVAIAGVMAVRPQILILDEPTAGLDPMSRQEFMKRIAELNRQGTTILMVSHDADCLCEYAHRILVLQSGRLIMDGTPQQVFAQKHADLPIGTSWVCAMAETLYQAGKLPSPAITNYRDLLQAILNTRNGGDTP